MNPNGIPDPENIVWLSALFALAGAVMLLWTPLCYLWRRIRKGRA